MVANGQQQAATAYLAGEKKMSMGNTKGAIVDFTKAIETDPDALSAYYKRGFAYSVLGEYELAVKDYTYVINKKNDFLWAYISRGSAYNKLNKFNEALADFNRALEIDPKNQEVYNNRGWAKKGLGDDAGACEDWKTSRKMGNEEAKIILGNSGCKK